MDLLDYFKEDGTYIGTTTKGLVHSLGLWHKVAGCIFIDSTKNSIYFQYKSAAHNEVAHKNKIDLSVGGHIISGETVEQGLLREIKEESSLEIDPKDLFYVGKRITNVDATPTYLIREFVYMYLLDRKFDLNELKSCDDEVLYYIEFNIDELLNFITSKGEKIVGNTPTGLIHYTKEEFIKGYLDDDIYYKILMSVKEYLGTPNNNKPNKLELTNK